MIAVIDVGSNSVRYMGAERGKTLFKQICTTRLGAGLSQTNRLSPSAIELGANAVADFCRRAESAGAERVYAFATAAVRSATNGAEFTARVKDLCGLEIDVVSGEREARLGLLGAVRGDEGGMIDVGGASSEVGYLSHGEVRYSVSLPVGAVRLFDLCGQDRTLLEREVEKRIKPLSAGAACGITYAIGGTATTLAALKHELEVYDPAVTDGTLFRCDEVCALYEKLISLSPAERKNLKGMDVRRAEIIAGGTLVLLEIMKRLELTEIIVSERDNLEGYLVERGLV